MVGTAEERPPRRRQQDGMMLLMELKTAFLQQRLIYLGCAIGFSPLYRLWGDTASDYEQFH